MSRDLTSLFIAHEREISRYLQRKVGRTGDASDLYQDAFLRLARFKEPENIENPLAFIFTMVANLARDHMRRFIRRTKVETGETDQEIASGDLSPEELYFAQQQDCALQKAINGLPARTRSVFLKYYVEGGSYREIGEHFGISPRTVEYHLRQALAYCRSEMQDAGLV